MERGRALGRNASRHGWLKYGDTGKARTKSFPCLVLWRPNMDSPRETPPNMANVPQMRVLGHGDCVSQTNLRPNEGRTAPCDPGYDQINPNEVCLAAYLAQFYSAKRPLGGAKGPLGGANTHPPCVFCARRVYWTLPLAYVLCGNTTGHGTEGPIWGCSVENSASPHTAGVFGIRPRGARCDETSVRG